MHTALGHLDDQLTEVRNAMADAKESDEIHPRPNAQGHVRPQEAGRSGESRREADQKTGTFRIVANRDSQLNPDLGHASDKSIAKRMWKTEDLACEPASRGTPQRLIFWTPNTRPSLVQHHPQAVKGAGANSSLTSKMQSA